MLRIRARITLYNEGRITSFISGYRPLFNFINEMKKSGKIILLDRQEFLPGDEAEVDIIFIDKQWLGEDFRKGTKFTFGEGLFPLGNGEIMEVSGDGI
jgi:translation elongation factor EF-Tu-like GTPase